MNRPYLLSTNPERQLPRLLPASIVWGLAGIICFSLTLPVTRSIHTDFQPLFIGTGRTVLAALVALVLLAIYRAPLPTRQQLGQLALIASGVVFGFPILSALAMTSVPAGHGGVIAALFPLGTALAARFIAKEKPAKHFWLCSAAATLLVLGHAIEPLQGGLMMGDWALLLSLPLASIGYAMGGHLAKTMPGWQVICWALVVSLPLTAPMAVYSAPGNWQEIPTGSWSGLLYLALFSQLFGFFFWNKGLATGGIAYISQLQLLQPFLTIIAAAALLGEAITASAVVVSLLVATLIFWGRK